MIRGKRCRLYSSFENKLISLDSNLERRFYYWALRNKFIKSIKRNTSIKIPYVYNGISHKYVPDWIAVFTNKEVALIEIKPRYLIDDPVVKSKSLAAANYCRDRKMRYYIFTENFNVPIIL